MNNPISYQTQMYMDYFNVQPSQVKGQANWQVETQKRYLWTKIASVYEFTQPWPTNWFRFWLFRPGSIAVLYTKEYGWISGPYGYTELGFYYQPKVIQMYNHLLPNVKTGIVGVNAGIIRIMDDYYGLDDLVSEYAQMFANINKSFNISLMNSNMSLVYGAESTKQATDIKEAYERATTGQPLVTVNEKLLKDQKLLQPLISNPKNMYIGKELLEARRSLMNNFLTDIGIRNTNTEKRAQRSTEEIEQNLDETASIVSVIRDNIKEGMEEINRISGLGLDVKLRYNYDNLIGGGYNGQTDSVGD